MCRGEKLTRASKLSKERAEEFVLPIASPWEGSLRAERTLWGYTETPDPDCDFEGEYYDISRAYKALNVLPESEDESESEGSNQCFRVFHYDPEKVDENGGDVAIQDQTYKVNDRVYRVSTKRFLRTIRLLTASDRQLVHKVHSVSTSSRV